MKFFKNPEWVGNIPINENQHCTILLLNGKKIFTFNGLRDYNLMQLIYIGNGRSAYVVEITTDVGNSKRTVILNLKKIILRNK